MPTDTTNGVVRVAVIHYSGTGNVHELAQTVGNNRVGDVETAAAAFLGRRVAQVAARLRAVPSAA